MNIRTMRIVDAWAGGSVCAGLTALRRCGDLRRRLRGVERPEVRRILFVKLAEQGATVLAYPAIRRAVRMVGRENVYFLVFEENRFILDLMEAVPPENVITIPSRRLDAALFGAIRALRRLRKLRLDAAVDLEFFARSSAALSYLSGASTRVGLHRFNDHAPYRGDLMTHRLRYNPHLHTAQTFALLAEAIEASPRQLPVWPGPPPAPCTSLPAFRPGEEEQGEVEAMVRREAGAADFRPLVLLNANASDLLPLRRWPADRYVELARRILRARPDVRVAFTGAPHEAPVAQQLADAVGDDRCFSVAGKTTLRQLVTLYCLADVLVTNDSGPAHFATLTPIHVITLFGPETPALFGARSPNARILWKRLPCSPCVSALNNRHSICKDNQCMKQIAVDEVFQQVGEVLRERAAAAMAENTSA